MPNVWLCTCGLGVAMEGLSMVSRYYSRKSPSCDNWRTYSNHINEEPWQKLHTSQMALGPNCPLYQATCVMSTTHNNDLCLRITTSEALGCRRQDPITCVQSVSTWLNLVRMRHFVNWHFDKVMSKIFSLRYNSQQSYEQNLGVCSCEQLSYVHQTIIFSIDFN